MKELPFTMSDDVAEYLASRLANNVDPTMQASLIWAQNSWRGEEPLGPQVMLGFFSKGTTLGGGVYHIRGHSIVVSEETLSQLDGKHLMLERLRRQSAVGEIAIEIIRAISKTN